MLGKDAEIIYENLRAGMIVDIDGYLRTEIYRGKPVITVRVFSIQYRENDIGIRGNDTGRNEKRDGENTGFSKKTKPSG